MTNQKSLWERLKAWIAGWWADNQDEVEEMAVKSIQAIAAAAVTAALQWVGGMITERNKDEVKAKAKIHAENNYPYRVEKEREKIMAEIDDRVDFELVVAKMRRRQREGAA